jgi:hypothetical protein
MGSFYVWSKRYTLFSLTMLYFFFPLAGSFKVAV